MITRHASAATGDVWFLDSQDVEKVEVELHDRIVAPRDRPRSFVDVELPVAGRRIHSIRGPFAGDRHGIPRAHAPIAPLEELGVRALEKKIASLQSKRSHESGR